MPEMSFGNWSLYCGAIGVVLFWLELYCATRDEAHLKQALDGADHLRAVLPLENCADEDLGMYFGFSGAVYMFEQAHQIAGRPVDHETAQRCIGELRRHAVVARAKGLTWGRGQEIGGGRAGSGLIVLWWARTANDESVLELAVQAGHAIVRRAKPYPKGGLWWDRESIAEFVGFAHGCSGPAYYLAALYEVTREQIFLDTAIAAVDRLQRIAIEQAKGGWLIPSHVRDGDEVVSIRNLNWCAGAAAILRPFALLGQVTNDSQWTDWVHRIALGMMNSGIPENRDGLMPRSAILCCGDAGVSQAFLDLHLTYKYSEYLPFARRMFSSALEQATVDEMGMRWYEAPNEQHGRHALTGFMTGAAGIGVCALNFDALEQNRQPAIKLPDSPF